MDAQVGEIFRGALDLPAHTLGHKNQLSRRKTVLLTVNHHAPETGYPDQDYIHLFIRVFTDTSRGRKPYEVGVEVLTLLQRPDRTLPPPGCGRDLR